MKKLSLVLFACMTPFVIMAHEVPVPHAHQDHVHGIVPFLQYVVLPVVIGLSTLRLYRYFRKLTQA